MSGEDIIFDIKRIASASTISKDNRLDEEHILHKINSYRAIFIEDHFTRTRTTSPFWWQTGQKFEFRKITSEDEPTVPSTVCLGKVLLPLPIRLENNIGLVIRGSARQQRWYETNLDSFYLMYELNDWRLGKFIYYWIIENAVFNYPFTAWGIYDILAANPMDIPVKNTLPVASGDLLVGISYTVINAQITYNSIIYNPGDTFTQTGAVWTYTGPGTIIQTNPYRNRDIRDNYPLDIALAQRIAMEILTKDLMIERQAVADIVTDSQDQLRILSSLGGGPKRR